MSVNRQDALFQEPSLRIPETSPGLEKTIGSAASLLAIVIGLWVAWWVWDEPVGSPVRANAYEPDSVVRERVYGWGRVNAAQVVPTAASAYTHWGGATKPDGNR